MILTVSVHDCSNKHAAVQDPITVTRGTVDALGPYAILHIGGHVDFFMTPERLRELHGAVEFYLVRLEEEMQLQRADAAIEARDEEETGADRCPPRE